MEEDWYSERGDALDLGPREVSRERANLRAAATRRKQSSLNRLGIFGVCCVEELLCVWGLRGCGTSGGAGDMIETLNHSDLQKTNGGRGSLAVVDPVKKAPPYFLPQSLKENSQLGLVGFMRHLS